MQHGRRLLVLDVAVQILSFFYLLFVVADCIDGVTSDVLVPRQPWRSIVVRTDVACQLFFLLGLIVRGIIEGPRLFEVSAVNLTFAHRAVFVVINLSISLSLLATLDGPSLALVRASRYVKLISAYSRFWSVLYALSQHAGRLKSLLSHGEEAHLCWSDLSTLQLRAPFKPGGYHVFISHSWRFAQDMAGTINGRLRSLGVGCRCFLDVQDLDDIAALEVNVERSDLVLIILTEFYISSINCRRELTAAYVSNKPLVVLLESDAGRGSTSAAGLRAELEEVENNGRLKKEERKAVLHLIGLLEQLNLRQQAIPTVIEWHREVELKQIAYKTNQSLPTSSTSTSTRPRCARSTSCASQTRSRPALA